MDADALFAQADVNKDQRLDINEFRALFPQDAGGADGASYDTSDSSGWGNISGFDPSGVFDTSAYEAAPNSAAIASSLNGARSAGGGSGLSAAQLNQLGFRPTKIPFERYQTDAQGHWKDPNPVTRKEPAKNGNLVYNQNIKIRFLQPPPPPQSGPITIVEEQPRLPQRLPPLYIPQPAPPAVEPLPIIIRERPPPKPAAIRAETFIYTLPPPPAPPRPVIYDIDARAPPKPRDIFMERWLPYGRPGPRQVIVKRATNIQQYAPVHNTIIVRDPPAVRVTRNFQRLGITQADPDAYIRQYGPTLLDTSTFVQRARSLGVVEDISLPIAAAAVATGQSQYTTLSGGFSDYSGRFSDFEPASTIGTAGFDTTGLTRGVVGFNEADDAGGAGEYSSRASSR